MQDFDKYAKNYEDALNESVSFTNLKIDFFTRAKVKRLQEFLLDMRPLQAPGGKLREQLIVLDLGCGVGVTDSSLIRDGLNLFGVDTSEESIEIAKLKNPDVQYSVYDGNTLPFGNETFDFVFIINVMHHILPEHYETFLWEARRVIKIGGRLAVFEHNPFNPLTVKAVKDCPFDEGVTLLSQSKLKRLLRRSGFEILRADFILFFPWEKPFFFAMEKKLSWLPLGAQHFCLARKTEPETSAGGTSAGSSA